MKISWKIYVLPLASPFGISKGTFTHRRALIVRLEKDGLTGLGEATEITYYGISLDRYAGMIRQYRQELEKIPFTTPQEYYFRLSAYFSQDPFLLCAFDCAAHDLYGKLEGKPAREHMGVVLREGLPKTSFTIGLGPVDEMINKILDRPWPIYKIKLGSPQDMSIMEAIRSTTEAVLRVDANEGWELNRTLEYSTHLHELGVEFVEQPVPRKKDQELSAILPQSPLPLIADESCQTYPDVQRCQGLFHGINIKLMKCGGLTPALHMVDKARYLGLKVMVGCMTESSIGISAAAQLLPLVDYADLDGTLLIKEDIATGVRLEQGEIIFTDGPGLDCHLLDEKGFQ